MKIDRLVLLSVILCAVVLAGELMAYGPNPHGYGADTEFDGNTVTVTVSSSGSDMFSAVIMDNGVHSNLTQLYIYLDERYREFFDDAKEEIGLKGLDIRYSIDQIRKSLRIRGFDNVMVCNDGQLLTAMLADMSGNVSKGLLVMSYALPESIYSGSESDLLFDWIENGGSLYWTASPIGMFYRTSDELVRAEGGQGLFFGKECVSMNDTGPALSVIDGNPLTDTLALKWNRTLYGLNISGVEGAVSMGFSQNGYSSVSMVPFGSGMICVFGGNYDRNQCDDIAQIISSGVSCYSKILDTRSGTVTRGSVEFSFETPEDAGNISLYVSIGGYYTVFGRSVYVQ